MREAILDSACTVFERPRLLLALVFLCLLAVDPAMAGNGAMDKGP
jgi:hypothetical protein